MPTLTETISNLLAGGKNTGETPSVPSTSAPAPLEEPAVVDLALFNGPMRTVQALRNSGIVPNDEAQSTIQTLKRVNRAITADGAELSASNRAALAKFQSEFKGKVAEMPYEKLVSEGHVNKVLHAYLDILTNEAHTKIAHLENEPLSARESNPTRFNEMLTQARAKLNKHLMDSQYYEKNPQVIMEAASKFPAIIRSGKYMPLGKLVAESGITGMGKDAATDAVADVLGVKAARDIKLLARTFADDATLKRYENDPEMNRTRILALAEAIAQITKPLNSMRDGEEETQALGQIIALGNLFSMRLNHAMSQDRAPADLITIEEAARGKTQEASQVMMSLALHHLDTGPSAQDKRIRAMHTNLKNEMLKSGIAELSLAEAQMKAREIARASAEDLLVAVGDNADYQNRIEKLAVMAGVEISKQPLAAKPDLIGVDVVAKVQQMLQNPHAFVPTTGAGYLEKLAAERSTPAASSGRAA